MSRWRKTSNPSHGTCGVSWELKASGASWQLTIVNNSTVIIEKADNDRMRQFIALSLNIETQLSKCWVFHHNTWLFVCINFQVSQGKEKRKNKRGKCEASVSNLLGVWASQGNGQALHPLLSVLTVLGLQHKGLVRSEDLEGFGDVATTAPNWANTPDLAHFNGLYFLVILQAPVW